MSDALSDMIVKFLTRLLFVLLVLIIVPLAVQNRQIITVELNPLALLNSAYSLGFSLPLFIVLILTLSIGLLSGLMFGWGLARLQARKKAGQLKRAVPPAPIPAGTKMLKAGQTEKEALDVSIKTAGD